ncbi:MAG: hypothetical protein DVB26_01290 [Verrucomicrobia bacterium]|nr:MAG: hypothetical protein DVB26_01290 [Verrucomicrobiota bacterium]
MHSWVNLIRLLPPTVALVIVGAWLTVLHLSIAAMESQNRMLGQLIAIARSGGPPGSPPHAAASDKSAKASGPLDWRKLAGLVLERQKSGGLGDLRTLLHFQQRLQTMTREELVAALDEITALELPANSRSMLEPLLLAPLIDKDPALVLTRFTSRLDELDEAINRQLAMALRAYAQRSPREAVDWLGRQVDSGKFASAALNGRNPTRLQLESALLGALLTADPAATVDRLAALPQDQRAEAIGNAALDQNMQTDLTWYARLVRGQVPASEQAAAFARQVALWVAQGGYASATEFLNAIKLTPEERLACIEQAVTTQIFSTTKKLGTADLDALRDWVNSQAPQETASVTAQVLCTAAMGKRKLDFSQAAQLAIQSSQASGNDDALIGFVECWAARSNKDEARELAEKITDAKRRAATLKRLE